MSGALGCSQTLHTPWRVLHSALGLATLRLSPCPGLCPQPLLAVSPTAWQAMLLPGILPDGSRSSAGAPRLLGSTHPCHRRQWGCDSCCLSPRPNTLRAPAVPSVCSVTSTLLIYSTGICHLQGPLGGLTQVAVCLLLITIFLSLGAVQSRSEG